MVKSVALFNVLGESVCDAETSEDGIAGLVMVVGVGSTGRADPIRNQD